MGRGQHEIVVGRQQGERMADTELRQNGVDGTYLQTGPATAVSQFRRIDVILPVRGQERQGCEPVDNVFARARTGKSLQQFLQNESGGQDSCATFKGIAQRSYLRSWRSSIAPEGERPHAGVDEQAHRRERSAL
jgi:hypothetical protein